MAGQLLRPKDAKKNKIVIIDFLFTYHLKINLIWGMRNSIIPNPSNNQPPAKDHMDPDNKVG